MRSEITHVKIMNPVTKNVITFCFMLPMHVFMAKLKLRLNDVLSRAIWFFLKLCDSMPSLNATIGWIFDTFEAHAAVTIKANTIMNTTGITVAGRLNET